MKNFNKNKLLKNFLSIFQLLEKKTEMFLNSNIYSLCVANHITPKYILKAKTLV